MREKYSFEAEEIPEQEVQHETVSSTKIRQAVKDGYIQKANAYLDHYYIVMGNPVHYDYENPHYPLSLVKIPLTEECKLLPANGIYAVSFESGSVNSRGMIIINDKEQGGSEVLLHLFDSDYNPVGIKSTIFFHKKVHGALAMDDLKSSAPRLRAAIGEISELIY